MFGPTTRLMHRPTRAAAARPRAFSLTEVMFAVIVMGIGFIMVAAIFPVTISQSKQTVEETTAAAMARGGMALTGGIGGGSDFNGVGPLMPITDLYTSPPATAQAAATTTADLGGSLPTVAATQRHYTRGKVLSFHDIRLNDATGGGTDFRNNLWNAVKGSIVVPSDPRFAWVPFYRRDTAYINPQVFGGTPMVIGTPGMIVSPAPFAQVYMIPVAVRTRSTYDNTDVAGVASNLQPRHVQVLVRYETTIAAYVFEFGPSVPPLGSGTVVDLDSIAEGAVVIISDDRIHTPVQDRGIMNGRTYRVGAERPDVPPTIANGRVFEMAPGSEFKPDPGANGLLAYRRIPPVPPDVDDIVEIGNTLPIGGGGGAVARGPAEAFVIGRNPTGTGQYEGPAQDIGVFVTFIRVN